ncbi:MAG TPA: hypothetical protein VIW67_15205 [Terriglobales bacterium]|jgi:hypothetical protein
MSPAQRGVEETVMSKVQEQPIFVAEVYETGVRIKANPTCVSDANEAALRIARGNLALRLLHEQMVGETTEPVKELRPQIFVPRVFDEELGEEFEQLPLRVAPPLRPIDFRNLPGWLVNGLRKAKPQHPFWKTTDQLDGTEAAWMILQEYCGRRGFLDHEGLIDDEKRGQVLVSEPYALSHEQLGELMVFVSDADLKVRITGASNYAPSATLRIEIWK